MACHLHLILCTWDAVTCTPVTVFFPLGVQLCSKLKYLWKASFEIHCTLVSQFSAAIGQVFLISQHTFTCIASHSKPCTELCVPILQMQFFLPLFLHNYSNNLSQLYKLLTRYYSYILAAILTQLQIEYTAEGQLVNLRLLDPLMLPHFWPSAKMYIMSQ